MNWIQNLEQLLENKEENEVNKYHRLWLSASPQYKFSNIIL